VVPSAAALASAIAADATVAERATVAATAAAAMAAASVVALRSVSMMITAQLAHVKLASPVPWSMAQAPERVPALAACSTPPSF